MSIENYLGKGAANAKTRAELCIETGMGDRTLRLYISKARKRGVPIVSSSSAAGYYLAATAEEREIAAREYMARAMQCFEVARNMQRLPFGQLELEACGE